MHLRSVSQAMYANRGMLARLSMSMAVPIPSKNDRSILFRSGTCSVSRKEVIRAVMSSHLWRSVRCLRGGRCWLLSKGLRLVQGAVIGTGGLRAGNSAELVSGTPLASAELVACAVAVVVWMLFGLASAKAWSVVSTAQGGVPCCPYSLLLIALDFPLPLPLLFLPLPFPLVGSVAQHCSDP